MLDWCCPWCSCYKLLWSHNCLIAIENRVLRLMLFQGASGKKKQPSHFNNFIMKKFSVKSPNYSESLKQKNAVLFFSNDFLNVRLAFTKINRPNQTSNLVTAVENSLTAWIRVGMINWSIFMLSAFVNTNVLVWCI